MASAVVVLKGHARLCQLARETTYEPLCMDEGTYHIAWARHSGAGFSTLCDVHFGSVLRDRRYVVAQWHFLEADCGMPATGWNLQRNLCEIWDGRGPTG